MQISENSKKNVFLINFDDISSLKNVKNTIYNTVLDKLENNAFNEEI
jgi:hypothetical protein